MAVEIREITPTKSSLKKYTKFGIDLYKGCLLYTSDAADEL